MDTGSMLNPCRIDPRAILDLARNQPGRPTAKKQVPGPPAPTPRGREHVQAAPKAPWPGLCHQSETESNPTFRPHLKIPEEHLGKECDPRSRAAQVTCTPPPTGSIGKRDLCMSLTSMKGIRRPREPFQPLAGPLSSHDLGFEEAQALRQNSRAS